MQTSLHTYGDVRRVNTSVPVSLKSSSLQSYTATQQSPETIYPSDDPSPPIVETNNIPSPEAAQETCTFEAFDTVLAVVGVYQAARHNYNLMKGDESLRHALTEAADLVESLISYHQYLDERSQQLLDFFLTMWSWQELEVVAPPANVGLGAVHGVVL